MFREQGLYGKEQAKQRYKEWALEWSDNCKTHRAQVTKTSDHIIPDFTLEELQIETCYLKNTIAPNINMWCRSSDKEV